MIYFKYKMKIKKIMIKFSLFYQLNNMQWTELWTHYMFIIILINIITNKDKKIVNIYHIIWYIYIIHNLTL